ncbi:hypothetical protein HFD88_002648 [Aspergillus terreus]|nr:hypothetical protein HFD88_002648 [Aspergillus terreus]
MYQPPVRMPAVTFAVNILDSLFLREYIAADTTPNSIGPGLPEEKVVASGAVETKHRSSRQHYVCRKY